MFSNCDYIDIRLPTLVDANVDFNNAIRMIFDQFTVSETFRPVPEPTPVVPLVDIALPPLEPTMIESQTSHLSQVSIHSLSPSKSLPADDDDENDDAIALAVSKPVSPLTAVAVKLTTNQQTTSAPVSRSQEAGIVDAPVLLSAPVFSANNSSNNTTNDSNNASGSMDNRVNNNNNNNSSNGSQFDSFSSTTSSFHTIPLSNSQETQPKTITPITPPSNVVQGLFDIVWKKKNKKHFFYNFLKNM